MAINCAAEPRVDANPSRWTGTINRLFPIPEFNVRRALAVWWARDHASQRGGPNQKGALERLIAQSVRVVPSMNRDDLLEWLVVR
jgi:hypothetical protein